MWPERGNAASARRRESRAASNYAQSAGGDALPGRSQRTNSFSKRLTRLGPLSTVSNAVSAVVRPDPTGGLIATTIIELGSLADSFAIGVTGRYLIG